MTDDTQIDKICIGLMKKIRINMSHVMENLFLYMRKKQMHSLSAPCFDSTILLIPKSEISSLQSTNVVLQSGFFRTLSQTLKTGCLVHRGSTDYLLLLQISSGVV